jgi:uncharacterized membrane protein
MGPLIIFIVAAELLNAIGQTFFKKTANVLAMPPSGNIRSVLNFFIQVLRSKWVWLGLVSMGFGLILWICALSRGDLSLVYPIGSIHYLMVIFSAWLFLREKIDRYKILGTVFVIIGILLIARS